jgi:hypothetical protein
VLQDPYGEFMVVEDRTQTKETLEEDFNARYVHCVSSGIFLFGSAVSAGLEW